jgi:pyruvate/2-oxoglutarate dehydrogenase complex dihydrolipoamide dehydrogenase (E3) component
MQFDAIIIGTGQAGPPLAGKLAKAGWKVAIIERSRYGGTCVNTGCIPTKTLIASARAAWVARQADKFGVVVNGAVSIDMAKVKARKDVVSGASRKGIEDWLKHMANCTVYEGQARFVSDHEVAVGAAKLTAPRIFINVGGRAMIPDWPGLADVPYLTNSSIMNLDSLPTHLIIVGGSYIGLEFAQMYRRFGSKVTIIEKGPRLLGREDVDVSETILEILTREGIDVRLNSNCIATTKQGNEISVKATCDPTDIEVRGSHLLLAMGRRPNTDDLGLEHTGVVLERGVIQVDEDLQTAAHGIWALGDCNGRGAFTHTSYNDFEIVEANVLHGEQRRVSDRITAYALYIDPPLGRAGMTDAEVRRSGRRALVGKRPMTRVGRAVEKGETQGFMKIVVDADSKQILGAAILGIEGDEAIHCILDTMYAKAPYTTLQRAMHIHPTVSELIPTVLGELAPLEQMEAKAHDRSAA